MTEIYNSYFLERSLTFHLNSKLGECSEFGEECKMTCGNCWWLNGGPNNTACTQQCTTYENSWDSDSCTKELQAQYIY